MLMVYIIIKSGVFLVAWEYDLKSLCHVSRLSYFGYGGAACIGLGVLSLGGVAPAFWIFHKVCIVEVFSFRGEGFTSGCVGFGKPFEVILLSSGFF